MSPLSSASFSVEMLQVTIHPSRAAMGAAAAIEGARAINEAVQSHGEARVVVASAPSQVEMLTHLAGQPVNWSRVTLFHMDEYLGIGPKHPASFRHFQAEHFLSRIQPRAFEALRGEADDPEAECRRYANLLRERPIDLVCLGIGENGHLAFNDPPVADFADPEFVKVVELDQACREQQVHDGCFRKLEDVPTHALTLTIPALMSGRHLTCVVPGPRKAAAVRASLSGAVRASLPASILRHHPSATLHLDTDSAALLEKEI